MTNEEVFEEIEDTEEFSSLEDITPAFLKNPKVGEKIEFKVKGFKIIKEKDDLEFSYEDPKSGKQKRASNALSSVAYGIQIHTTEKQVYWISSWAVWGQLKAIGKKLNNMSLANLDLQVDHINNGMLEEHRDNAWVVRTKIGDDWKQLSRETNDWV